MSECAVRLPSIQVIEGCSYVLFRRSPCSKFARWTDYLWSCQKLFTKVILRKVKEVWQGLVSTIFRNKFTRCIFTPLWICYVNPLSLQMLGQAILGPFETFYQSRFTRTAGICGRFSHLPPPLEKKWRKSSRIGSDWRSLFPICLSSCKSHWEVLSA